MELMKKFMNLLLPPILLITLFVLLPPYIVYKFIQYLLSTFSEEDLNGKVVLITGASAGIGENLAYEYAKRGARLVLVARRENILQVVAEKARELGSPEVVIIAADVSKYEDCKRFVEETIDHFGRLDHLVNNAGITTFGRFQDSKTINNLTPLMNINFWGSVYPSHFAVPHLKKTRGKIIVNASMTGLLPNEATKAALINFYESLRVELGSMVKITLVCPGFTESEMTRGKHLSFGGETEVDQSKADLLIGRIPMGTARECAEGIVKGACRDDKYVFDSMWWRVLVLWNNLAPDIVQVVSRLLFFLNKPARKTGTNVFPAEKPE
ncbi:hypothetical protein GIB67_041787 [Kingdonia uniflora]|uniref:Uncharacterized protein n=1 Tax=Kingdonia uniflora TaxID=39325 RepID=A0A7J7L5S6_9MAGN|nr:hypothetical protein GIB67_041787 [Kingdonia uniflora]